MSRSTRDAGRRFADVQIRIGNHPMMIAGQARIDLANASSETAREFLEGVMERAEEEE